MTDSADPYFIPRGTSEAERLELQHGYILACQGYYLHPDLPPLPAGARIADLATGTAIWLREVAAAKPTVECHGFDISDTMFPAPPALPANVTLHLADVKKPFDARWIGYFDVVHVRLLQAAMSTDDWGPVLRNITTLLKPGGWLQWMEDDRARAVRRPMRPVAPFGAAQASLASQPPAWRPLPQHKHMSNFTQALMPGDIPLALSQGYVKLDDLMADPQYGNLQQVACDGFVVDRMDDGGTLRKGWAAMSIHLVLGMVPGKDELVTKIAPGGIDEWAKKSSAEVEAGWHYVSQAAVFTGRKRLE
ncbi:S-adenosyl-L-methionine-dependent methyltransferase [Neohortaea acidophila]|uniref:S-adenosyl-L-methionine-dependent methyltransferase n=1 Tax=Neohortaea acidophila TaxID=245834 RepID=A0A6A6PPY7_9PEZI|nr:S-adenosyl-L-methionine-dependent methyltransferase [Neohortaea acidophila]KAF2481694.1 S-adenosyl-L-methionine-dependent methyltransferase [Neohortaea acidophila]